MRANTKSHNGSGVREHEQGFPLQGNIHIFPTLYLCHFFLTSIGHGISLLWEQYPVFIGDAWLMIQRLRHAKREHGNPHAHSSLNYPGTQVWFLATLFNRSSHLLKVGIKTGEEPARESHLWVLQHSISPSVWSCSSHPLEEGSQSATGTRCPLQHDRSAVFVDHHKPAHDV